MSIVSVIIPVFNREKFIVDILTLLKKQNYRPLEVVIVDDASTDNTVGEINSFIKNNSDKQFNLFLYKNKNNKGACYCRNYGIHNSNGKYIQFQYTLQSQKMLEKVFSTVKIKSCLLNIPPAFVYTCSKE